MATCRISLENREGDDFIKSISLENAASASEGTRGGIIWCSCTTSKKSWILEMHIRMEGTIRGSRK